MVEGKQCASVCTQAIQFPHTTPHMNMQAAGMNDGKCVNEEVAHLLPPQSYSPSHY